MTKKHTYEKVKEDFEARGFELLSDTYVNARTKLKYICSCGNVSEMTYDNFMKGNTCKKCAAQRAGAKQVIPYQEVQKVFQDNGCVLLESSYVNCDTPMKYQCKCGEVSSITYYHMKNGSHCQTCGDKKIGDKHRLDFDTVRTEFEKRGCVLLETHYKDAKQKLRYTCTCGNESFISLDGLKAGKRCPGCLPERKVQSCLAKYGVEHYSQTEECKTKKRQTCLDKYGVEHTMHVPEIHEKQQLSAYKSKPYTLPSGKQVQLHGYEPTVLQQLLTKYNEDEIYINKGEMPKIMYTFGGKKRRYYPDFYIHKDNLILVVKSLYTYRKNIVRNMLKALATRRLGYNYEIHIVEPNKETIII